MALPTAKCRSCNGDLEINVNEGFAECPFCRTKYIILDVAKFSSTAKKPILGNSANENINDKVKNALVKKKELEAKLEEDYIIDKFVEYHKSCIENDVINRIYSGHYKINGDKYTVELTLSWLGSFIGESWSNEQFQENQARKALLKEENIIDVKNIGFQGGFFSESKAQNFYSLNEQGKRVWEKIKKRLEMQYKNVSLWINVSAVPAEYLLPSEVFIPIGPVITKERAKEYMPCLQIKLTVEVDSVK